MGLKAKIMKANKSIEAAIKSAIANGSALTMSQYNRCNKGYHEEVSTLRQITKAMNGFAYFSIGKSKVNRKQYSEILGIEDGKFTPESVINAWHEDMKRTETVTKGTKVITMTFMSYFKWEPVTTLDHKTKVYVKDEAGNYVQLKTYELHEVGTDKWSDTLITRGLAQKNLYAEQKAESNKSIADAKNAEKYYVEKRKKNEDGTFTTYHIAIGKESVLL